MVHPVDHRGHNLIPLNHLEPYWLQDAQDQKCFGSMGLFSECGDTNLWRVIPKSKRHARRRQWIRWAIEEEIVDREQQHSLQGYYALQIFHPEIFDRHDSYTINYPERNVRISSDDAEEDFTTKECLARRRKDNKLVIVPCSEDRAWYWKLNEFGILHFDKPSRGFGGNSRRSASGNGKRMLNKMQTLEACVWRKNTSETFLSSCDENHFAGIGNHTNTRNDEDEIWDERLAKIQFVHRYTYGDAIVSHPPIPEKVFSMPQLQSRVGTEREGGQTHKTEQLLKPMQASGGNTRLPSRMDIAHSHASIPTDHKERRLSPFQVTSKMPNLSSKKVSKEIPRLLGNSNPILLATWPKLSVAKAEDNASSKRKSSQEDARTNPPRKGDERMTPQSLVPNTGTMTSSISEKPIVRKIQTNPYIEASENERWADPQTGLVYRTDLCEYLGHERKDVGRHTLTGVGQYTKTMLNIKVYGVGFYVSKRDILADPSFEPYASLPSESLRQSEDFFRILRGMKGFTSTNEPAGYFDRTIFLKINMQLSTDTMRSSLDADWKMLTPESKQLLIGSSMKPRPADPIFLEIAKSPENPNRCTCAQIAPVEYNADPSCCARGTELVFTWRKNGNLEVRLNGVFMDSFPRPDIAEGIFFEYLRLDNPMSFDFLDRVMDGFPALLAPLSQLKGITTPITAHQTSTPHHSFSNGNPLLRVIGGFGGAISSQAVSLAELVQSGTQELTNTAMEKARSVGSTAKNLGEEIERRRDLIGKHVSAFTNQALSSLVPSSQKSVAIQYPGWITDTELRNLSDEMFEQNTVTSQAQKTSYRRVLSRMIGLDDESLSASNITQKLFLGMVHLYLLLLLIASFPAQWTTRTKLVTWKKLSSGNETGVPIDSENSDSDESGTSSIEFLDTGSTMVAKNIQHRRTRNHAI